jgi:hypothetical protein
MSTTVGAVLLLSLGHFKCTCRVHKFLLFLLQVMSCVSKVNAGSKVLSFLHRSSCMRNAPANAIVQQAQIRLLSCVLYVVCMIKRLMSLIMLSVIGSRLRDVSLRFAMLSLFAIPFNTNFANSDLGGGSSAFMMCSCLIPAR